MRLLGALEGTPTETLNAPSGVRAPAAFAGLTTTRRAGLALVVASVFSSHETELGQLLVRFPVT